MTIHQGLAECTVAFVPSSANYRRYAEVARKLAKQPQASDRLMWAQLAALWDKAADRIAAKEKAGRVTPNGGEVHQP